jgi:hypothetical protein
MTPTDGEFRKGFLLVMEWKVLARLLSFDFSSAKRPQPGCCGDNDDYHRPSEIRGGVVVGESIALKV